MSKSDLIGVGELKQIVDAKNVIIQLNAGR